MTKNIRQTSFPKLNFIKRGKVRDLYAVKEYLLIVATDRISAFDVIMPNPIPGKGIILNRMSTFWFTQMEDIIGNHIISTDTADFPPECAPYATSLEGRSMLVKKANSAACRMYCARLSFRFRLERLSSQPIYFGH